MRGLQGLPQRGGWATAQGWVWGADGASPGPTDAAANPALSAVRIAALQNFVKRNERFSVDERGSLEEEGMARRGGKQGGAERAATHCVPRTGRTPWPPPCTGRTPWPPPYTGRTPWPPPYTGRTPWPPPCTGRTPQPPPCSLIERMLRRLGHALFAAASRGAPARPAAPGACVRGPGLSARGSSWQRPDCPAAAAAELGGAAAAPVAATPPGAPRSDPMNFGPGVTLGRAAVAMPFLSVCRDQGRVESGAAGARSK
jgi:hypothetical protein